MSLLHAYCMHAMGMKCIYLHVITRIIASCKTQYYIALHAVLHELHCITRITLYYTNYIVLHCITRCRGPLYAKLLHAMKNNIFYLLVPITSMTS